MSGRFASTGSSLIPRVEELEPPSGLSKPAKTEWRRLIPILSKAGILTEADRDPLAFLCQCWADWQKANNALQREGMIVHGKLNPWIRVRREAQDRYVGLCDRFGLTPSARVSLKVAAPKDQESKSGYGNARGAKPS